MNFKIGMRNIKTAIAVFLCMIISKILRLEYPFYAAIAAIITMQNSTVSSFKVGKDRMLGTLAGASVGLVFALIQPNNAILCGLGIIILIYICNLLNLNSSIPIAGIVFIAIMVNLNGKSPLLYSVNRIIDTFIGISVALAVNFLFIPYNNSDEIYKGYRALHEKVLSIIDQAICLGGKADLDSLNEDISKLTEQLNISTGEFRVKKAEQEKMNEIRRKLEFYAHIYEHFKIIQQIGSGRNLNEENIEKLKSLNFTDFKNAGDSNDELDIVYNYHISKVIKNFQITRAEEIWG